MSIVKSYPERWTRRTSPTSEIADAVNYSQPDDFLKQAEICISGPQRGMLQLSPQELLLKHLQEISYTQWNANSTKI